MEKTKYNIGRYSTGIVELSNSNTGACGGYRPADPFCKLTNKNISNDEYNRLIEKFGQEGVREEAEFYGTYHDNILEESYGAEKKQGGYYKENYIQRMKKRRQTIAELVENNFDSYTSMCITLTFDRDRVEGQMKYQKEQAEKANQERKNLQGGLSFFVEQLCDEILACQEKYPNKEMVIEALNREHCKGFFCDYKGFEEVIEHYKNINDFGTYAEYVNIFDKLCKMNGLKKVRKCCSDADLTDLSNCNKLFKKFIQKMRYRYDGFKYVAVMAHQNCGHWHYHVLCNVPYVTIDEFEKIWTYGEFELKKPKGTEELYKFQNYMIKNMNEQSWESLRGEKGYLASNNLKRNIIARSWATDTGEIELHEQTKKACAGIHRSFIKATDNKFNASFRYYKVKVKSTVFEPCKLAIKKPTHKFSSDNVKETKSLLQVLKEEQSSIERQTGKNKNK